MTSIDGRWPPDGPRSVIVVVSQAPDAAATALMCARVRTLLRREDVDAVTVDLGMVDDLDVGMVDALARLQLTARRLGGRVLVRAASADLRGLLSLAGLEEVICGPARLR